MSIQAAQGDVDFTNAGWNVGPDKYQDLKLTVANVSPYGPSFVMLRGPAGQTFPGSQVPEQWFWGSPPQGWFYGSGTRVDTNDHWRMEFQQDRTGVDNGEPIYATTANAYVSPGSNLQNQALTFTVVYPNGKQDVFPHTGQTLVAPFTNPTAPYSRVPAPYSITSFPGTVSWDKQLPSSGANNDPGDIHLNVDGLPDATTLTNVMLSNEFGQEWPFNQDGVNVPLRTAYSAHSTHADVYFPPVRDETNSRLMLRFTLGGMNYFKQFFGGPYDPSLRYPATATSIAEVWPSNDTDVNHAKDLQALANQSAVRYVHLNVGNGGIYELYAPLDLNHPISLLADPGVQLRFHPVDDTSANGLAWRNSPGAIRVNASHVGLNGFQVRFAGTMADWNFAASGNDNDNRAVIQMAGSNSQVDVSIVALDVQAPAPSGQQPSNLRAIDILKADTLDSGRINNNKFVGGAIELRGGPWEVLSNDYQGPPARTFSPAFVSAWTAHDLVVRANHAHLADPNRVTSGAGDRFFVLKEQGWGNLIQGNLVDGGYGQPTGATYSHGEARNAPENVLTESYSPHYEGWSFVSNGGQVLQIGDLRGARPPVGSVVAVLSGASR